MSRTRFLLHCCLGKSFVIKPLIHYSNTGVHEYSNLTKSWYGASLYALPHSNETVLPGELDATPRNITLYIQPKICQSLFCCWLDTLFNSFSTIICIGNRLHVPDNKNAGQGKERHCISACILHTEYAVNILAKALDQA